MALGIGYAKERKVLTTLFQKHSPIKTYDALPPIIRRSRELLAVDHPQHRWLHFDRLGFMARGKAE